MKQYVIAAQVAATRAYRTLISVFFLFSFASPVAVLQAQGYDSLPLPELPYQIQAPTGNFAIGDSLNFIFMLGDSHLSVNRAMGIEFQLTLNPSLQAPQSEIMDFSSSFLFDDSFYSNSSSFDPTTGKLSLSATRTDQQSRSGHGQLFRFTLVASEAIDSASVLVLSHGGMVMIDNLDMKRIAEGNQRVFEPLSGSNQPAHLYPNPAQDHIFLEWGSQGPSQVEIRDLNGRLLLSQTLNPMTKPHRIALESLPGKVAVYLLLLRYRDGRVFQQRFIRKPS